jgi:thiamine transport system substrate-binding protein
MTKNLTRSLIVICVTGLWLAACVPTSASTSQPDISPAPRTLTVMTHDSFSISESVLQAFQDQYNVRVQFLKSGDAGTTLNKAILAKDAPLADVLYGVDNTFLSRALDESIFDPYDSPLLATIPAQFQLDPQKRALPVDYGDVCLNYDKGYFSQKGLTPPDNLEDLTKPEYNGLLVVENPATSSPGLAFLLATIGYFGEQAYLDYWQKLVDNDVLVVNDWETAYNLEFTRFGGTRPIVVSYSSSPPFEVIYADTPIAEPHTAAVTSPQSCFRQIEFVGILRNTEKRDLAEAWVDFMLSTNFQEDIPLQMFVFPVNPNARLDEIFTKFLITPQKPLQLSPELIAANRETWITDWMEVVLR